jgi:hypothetical protein
VPRWVYTLEDAKRVGQELVAICHNPECRHRRMVDIDLVIRHVGGLHSLTPVRGVVHFSERMRCPRCKHRGMFIWIVDPKFPEPIFSTMANSVHLWNDSGITMYATVAQTSNIMIGWAAYRAAISEYPGKRITFQERARVINRLGNCHRAGTSYALQIAAGTYEAKVLGNKMFDCRHGVDFGDKFGVSRYAIVSGNTITKMREAGISSHTASDHCSVVDNIIECDPNSNIADGILWRSLNCQIERNKVINAGRNGIYVECNVTGAGDDAYIAVNNNVVEKFRGSTGVLVDKQHAGGINAIAVNDNIIVGVGAASSSGIVIQTDDSVTTTPYKNVSVNNNSIKDIASSGILVNAAGSGNTVAGVVISGNIGHSAGGAQLVYVLATTDGNISDIVVANNVLSGTWTRGIRCNNEENIVVTGNMVRGTEIPVTVTATNNVNANNLV